MRRHAPILAAALIGAACSSAPKAVETYAPGEPRPTSEHCRGLDDIEDLCSRALAADKSAQRELAERHRAAGNSYLWLFWLARAASSEQSEPVIVHVPSVADGPSSVMNSGPATPGPNSPEAQAEIDRLIQVAIDATPPRTGPRAVAASRESPNPVPFGIDNEACASSTAPYLPGYATSYFIAIVERPRVANRYRACWARDPETGDSCVQTTVLTEIEYDNVEILHDERPYEPPFGRSVRYFVRDLEGRISDTDLASEIAAIPRALIFSNVLESGQNIPTAPVIGMACALPDSP